MIELVDYDRINNTLGKMGYYLSTHNCVCVSVSGGADSDVIVHMIATHFREYLPKIHFVFANTGIEYRATLQHLKDLEQKYNIKIEEVRGMPIPLAVKKYGVPFCAKKSCDYLARLQKHGFEWEDGTLDTLLLKYNNSKVALRWWTNDFGDVSRFNVNWNKYLKEFLVQKKPKVKFSAQCCGVSKKAPLAKYHKSVGADLYITGERKSEGGARAGGHSNCFEKSHGLDHYMPLWFWDDDTKKYYCDHESIEHSDCYTVYGLKRTGCVGCPFGRNLWEELEAMQTYEPRLYKACWNVFGESYLLRKEFEDFKSQRQTNGGDSEK